MEHSLKPASKLRRALIFRQKYFHALQNKLQAPPRA